MNELTYKQLYIMIFFIPLVFKMSALPALLYEMASVTSYILIAVVVTVEFLQMGVVLAVANLGGMESIKEKYGTKVYILLSIPLIFVMFVKMAVFIQEIVYYVCSFLFYNIPEAGVMIALMLVIFYLAVKGIKAIGRLYEIAIWIIPIIIAFGLFFGEAKFTEIYLTPIFNENLTVYTSALGKYLIYAFDFSPLLFVRVKIKKVFPIAICSLFSVVAVTICYMLLYSAYGNASFLADFGFARLGTFNTVVSEIGSLDWPSSLLWLCTAILSLSFKLNAVNCFMNACKLKKAGTAVFSSGIVILLLVIFKNLIKGIQFATSGIQYAVFACEVAVPIIALALHLFKMKKENKSNSELNPVEVKDYAS